VFVSVCFRHVCPKDAPQIPRTHTNYRSAELARNRTRDIPNRAILETEVWELLLIWKRDIWNEVNRCAQEILRQLPKHTLVDSPLAERMEGC
jgi:G:T-mismatch repair DNA endonuclease (very short patch repair protein)